MNKEVEVIIVLYLREERLVRKNLSPNGNVLKHLVLGSLVSIGLMTLIGAQIHAAKLD